MKVSNELFKYINDFSYKVVYENTGGWIKYIK
jgi:hypothetical protein